MVVVSHLFFFLWKKLVRGAAHMSRPSHYLELSISRQPLLSAKSISCFSGSVPARQFFKTAVFEILLKRTRWKKNQLPGDDKLKWIMLLS